jgi:16S rRNA G966 N2-methylase RsmD
VTFLDRDPRALHLVAENLDRCGIERGYVMMRGDVERVARGRLSADFDLILLDPPYGEGDVPGMVATLDRHVAPGGLLVLEHARRRPPPESAGSLVRRRLVVSGDSALAFYERRADRADR